MMQRFALLVLLALSANAEQASLRSSRQLYNSNSSSSSSSSSSSGWSFWGSLLQLLDHVHAPCPPGPLHHKDENGDPLKRGECWSDLHHPPKPKKKSSSSHSSSSKSKVTYSACEQGEDGCFENVNCADGGDCNEYIKCVDQDGNAVDCFTNDDGQNIGGNGWKDDGYSVTDDATDDNSATDDAQNVVDDQWGSDGWSASNLDSGNSFASKSGNKSTPVWPFIVGALVAGVIGAAFIVSRVSLVFVVYCCSSNCIIFNHILIQRIPSSPLSNSKHYSASVVKKTATPSTDPSRSVKSSSRDSAATRREHSMKTLTTRRASPTSSRLASTTRGRTVMLLQGTWLMITVNTAVKKLCCSSRWNKRRWML